MTGDELQRLLDAESVQLIDVRTGEEYEGRQGYPCDPRQGHIPGAVHIEWTEFYAGEGKPHAREPIEALLRDRGVDPDTRIVAYCHSGQRSQMAVTALRAAGIEDAENYEASWHEWSRRET